MLSAAGLSSCSRNCRVYVEKLSMYRRCPSAYSVSSARLVLPLPRHAAEGDPLPVRQVEVHVLEIVDRHAAQANHRRRTVAIHADATLLQRAPRKRRRNRSVYRRRRRTHASRRRPDGLGRSL